MDPTRRIEGPALSIANLVRDDPIDGELLLQGSQVGRYSILSRLGAGGMGIVYKAWDPQLDRPVALKVLRSDWSSWTESIAERREALMREAQTLAKLSHPNIVTAYDAGLTENGVFIAMELCEGQTLQGWLREEGRTVREILEVFTAAGRGLAAAHAAGIVHRDFKLANVLIGDDGSVRVADFGLAHLVELAGPGAGDTEPAGLDDGERSVSTIVGTPSFMAPEQLLGRTGDHRQDQFSFCLCLYTALLGHPPFPGRTFHERREIVPLGLADEERERLHRARHVPARVRRALLRGLEVEPRRRFESMAALLAELAERRRWPWALSSGMLALGFGLGTLLAVRALAQEPCPAPSRALADAWDEEDRGRVREAFLATDHPDAERMFDRTAQALDDYAAQWSQVHATACEDTFVTRQQSELRFEAQTACLQRGRNHLVATVDAIASARDIEELQSRMVASFRLPPTEECAAAVPQPGRFPLPDDPEITQQIEHLRGRLDVALTLRAANDAAKGIAVAHDVVERARGLEYPPLLAEALEIQGRLQVDAAPPDEAERTLREAIEVAARSGERGIAARAWASLLFSLAQQDRMDEALVLRLAASAAVDDSQDAQAHAWLLNNLGVIHGRAGSFAAAREHFRRSLELQQQRLGEKAFEVGIAWSNLGTTLVKQDDPAVLDDARRAFEQARDIFGRTVGPEHTNHALARGGLCWVELKRGNYRLATSLCSDVLLHFERSPTTPWQMGLIHFRTARALAGEGRLDEAVLAAEHARLLMGPGAPKSTALVKHWMHQPSPDAKPADWID